MNLDERGFPGPASHIFVSQRLRLHYVDWGNRDAPPLILLHGGRDHCRNWDWLAAELRNDWHIVAPDLRGHGDSDHSPDGRYTFESYVYDLAQLIHQQDAAPVSIVAHSLGGAIALRYAGVYPEVVKRLVAIEGVGLPTNMTEPVAPRMRKWVDDQRALSSRQPRKYKSIDDALARMIAENQHLTVERARHLTIHGMMQNEDGTYSWKFDNYVRAAQVVDLPPEDVYTLWGRIECPVLLVWGKQSWAANPAEDGRLERFRNATVAEFDKAGHWVHHDRHDAFVEEVRAFLKD